MIQEVVQGQGNRIPRGYVINRIPCQTDTGRYIPINGVAFTVTEILESHRAPHFIRTVCKRSSYINTACILLPFGILLRGIPDFRIAVPQSQRIIPMGIYGSCKFRFHPGISELSFIDSMLEPGERIFIRPAEFVVKIHMVHGKFQTAFIPDKLFHTGFISPAFFRLQPAGSSLVVKISINGRHLESAPHIDIPRCGVIDFIQCLELGIDNPLIIKRIVDHFPAQSHRRAETIVKRMIPRQIQRIVRAVCLI